MTEWTRNLALVLPDDADELGGILAGFLLDGRVVLAGVSIYRPTPEQARHFRRLVGRLAMGIPEAWLDEQINEEAASAALSALSERSPVPPEAQSPVPAPADTSPKRRPRAKRGPAKAKRAGPAKQPPAPKESAQSPGSSAAD